MFRTALPQNLGSGLVHVLLHGVGELLRLCHQIPQRLVGLLGLLHHGPDLLLLRFQPLALGGTKALGVIAPEEIIVPTEEISVLMDWETDAVSCESAALPALKSSFPLSVRPTPAAAIPRLAAPAAMFTTAPATAQANFCIAPFQSCPPAVP